MAVITPEPLFSPPGGFYHGNVCVSFANADQVDIHYTLNGRPPDDSAPLYEAPIVIDKTCAIRAIACQSGTPPSDIITNTYFIDIPVNLPVISLVTDPDNFFAEEIGIYVTGINGIDGYCAGVISNVNQDWERPINIEFYEMDGAQALNQQAGVKIFGGCSRHRYPQKSLALYARSRYGKGSFRYKLFKEKEIDKFESFILRSAADDQMFTMLRDAVAQLLLATRMDADYQAYRPAVVYLNGDYWGIHNIREKINEHYIAENFGVDADDVNLLERRGEAMHGSNADYNAMFNYITTHDMSNPALYEPVKSRMDIDQYIGYMVGHIYLAERDWPCNNIKFWKANTGDYTRWRWINFDMDQTLTDFWVRENMIDKCTTASGPGWPNPEWSTRLFRNLLKNEEFKNQFINEYAWHMNTTFAAARVIGVIDSLANGIRAEIPHHIAKWGGLLDETGSAAESWIQPTFDSVEKWQANVEKMRYFARQRRQYTVKNVVEFFGLSGTSDINVNLNIPEAGRLTISRHAIADGFAGLFFNDIPLPLSVMPNSGYKLSHWQVHSAHRDTYYYTPDIEIALQEDVTVTAHVQESATHVENRAIMAGIEAMQPHVMLDANYPNPFNSSTEIHYSIDRPGVGQIDIYSILGSKVRTLVDQHLQAGDHRTSWDGTNERGEVVASGLYVVRLHVANGDVLSRNILFMR
ncbi:CotH kinase family protein [candidate division KSB1 bacterium]|nr:CotH kinase family protein [candidate division KSB1 bacterium]